MHRTAVQSKIIGSGPPVLLLHGCPGSHNDWKEVFTSLAEVFEVHAIDRPGYNRSVGSNFDLDGNVRAVRNYIVSKELKDVRLVGHSYGGSIVSRMTDDVTVRSTLAINAPLFNYTGAKLFGPLQRALVSLIPKSLPRGILFPLMKASLAPHFDTSRTDHLASLAEVASSSIEAMKSELLTLDSDLRRLPIPSYNFIAVSGLRDDVFFLSQAKQAEACGANHVQLDCGHYAQLEVPAEVAKIIKQM